MKSSKSTKLKPAEEEEECGVWLDTKELREKKQQKRLTRPISELLKPRRPGCSAGAALSFTQTRINMPVTRQSTISSFFSPKPRDPNGSAAQAGSTHPGAKRKRGKTSEPPRESTCQSPEVDLRDRDTDCDGSSAEQRFLHIICGDVQEEEQPPEKRRHVAHYTDRNVFERQEYWNKDARNEFPNQTYSHGAYQEPSEPKNTDKHVPTDGKAAGSVLTSRPVNENHRRSSASERKLKASPVKRAGKENNRPASSPFKRQIIPSPAKRSRLKEKCTLSPRKHASAETAGETLAELFTQDSEGFRVIAHPDQRPPEEPFYRNTGVEEEESGMLFTQDSEGNMVIKH